MAEGSIAVESPDLSSDSLPPTNDTSGQEATISSIGTKHQELITTKSRGEADISQRTEKYQEKLRNYAESKMALTFITAQLEKVLFKNANIKEDNLWKVAQSLEEFPLLSPDQKEALRLGISEYTKRHQLINDLYEKNPDNRKLFEKVFGKSPVGKLQTLCGPVTLYFRCFESKDYALVHSLAFMKGREVSEAEIEDAALSNAAQISSVNVYDGIAEDLRGSVAVENAFNKPDFDEEARKYYAHEAQHSVTQLFEEAQSMYFIKLWEEGKIDERHLIKEIGNPDAYIGNRNPAYGFVTGEFKLSLLKALVHPPSSEKFTAEEMRKNELHRLIREKREQGIDVKTKQEILSFLKEHEIDGSKKSQNRFGIDTESNVEEMISLLKEGFTKTRDQGGYDLFPRLAQQEIINEWVMNMRGRWKELLTITADQVFNKEYHGVIDRSLSAMKELLLYEYMMEKNQGQGDELAYNTAVQRTIHYFINEPLWKWYKIARRIIVASGGAYPSTT